MEDQVKRREVRNKFVPASLGIDGMLKIAISELYTSCLEKRFIKIISAVKAGKVGVRAEVFAKIQNEFGGLPFHRQL